MAFKPPGLLKHGPKPWHDMVYIPDLGLNI